MGLICLEVDINLMSTSRHSIAGKLITLGYGMLQNCYQSTHATSVTGGPVKMAQLQALEQFSWCLRLYLRWTANSLKQFAVDNVMKRWSTRVQPHSQTSPINNRRNKNHFKKTHFRIFSWKGLSIQWSYYWYRRWKRCLLSKERGVERIWYLDMYDRERSE